MHISKIAAETRVASPKRKRIRGEAAVNSDGLILDAETRIMGMSSETRRYGNYVWNESGNARLHRV
jgi:hypothetical protein